MTEPKPLVTNKELTELLARAKGMSDTNRDTMHEALVFVRGTYERELVILHQRINKLEEANDMLIEDNIKLRTELNARLHDLRMTRFEQVRGDNHE